MACYKQGYCKINLMCKHSIRIVYLILCVLIFAQSCKYRSRRHMGDERTLARDVDCDDGKRDDTPSFVKVPLTTEDGVLFITISINGVPMRFIFDTGASSISISETELLFLIKQGTIQENDVLGEQDYYDANGDRATGYVVNLDKVCIGDAELHNVEACVVMNQKAPLLLGQTALSRFGKVSIDYENKFLIFEK